MSDRLVCKPSPWFIFRAVAMLLMFGVFAVMFYLDGKTGYREKNLAYLVFAGFDGAVKEFSEHGKDADAWKRHAETRTIDLGKDPSVLPEGTPQPLPWPTQLKDYEKMKASVGNWRPLYDEYRLEAGIKKDAPEKFHDAQQIREQWIFFWICSACTLVTAFFLIRNLNRFMAVDDTTFYPPGARPVAIADIEKLDLRKWGTKGLAFAWVKSSTGAPVKIRIDGFIYGGFKKDQGEPAEALMQKLKASFSGELVDYATVEPTASEAPAPEA